MRRLAIALGILTLAPILTGCAAPVVAGITLGTLSTIASVVSVGISGKDIGDHALSTVAEKNCNLTEGLLRSDRDICEPKNSLATVDDFHGIFAYFGGERTDPLTRFARARQVEMAMVGPEYAVARREDTPTGLPVRGGDPGYVNLNGKLVYAMAPVYGAGDDRVAPDMPARSLPNVKPRPKPDPKDREKYQAMRTVSLDRLR